MITHSYEYSAKLTCLVSYWCDQKRVHEPVVAKRIQPATSLVTTCVSEDSRKYEQLGRILRHLILGNIARRAVRHVWREIM